MGSGENSRRTWTNSMYVPDPTFRVVSLLSVCLSQFIDSFKRPAKAGSLRVVILDDVFKVRHQEL